MNFLSRFPKIYCALTQNSIIGEHLVVFKRGQMNRWIGRGRGGFIGGMVSWFIRVIIYDICITFIQEITGYSRMTSLFIFLGILLVISVLGYFMKQRISPSIDG